MNHQFLPFRSRRLLRTTIVQAAVTGVAIGALAVPAVAAPSAAATKAGSQVAGTASPDLVGPAVRIPGDTSNSINWAGYVAQGGTFTSVSGTWVAPSVTCTSGAQQSAFWIGLDGWESDSVEQTGTAANCKGTKATYYAWYEMYPLPFHRYQVAVDPGDTLSASITYSGDNGYAIRLADATQGWTKTTKVTVSGDERLSAEAIAEAPCCTASGNPEPLSQFSPLTFTNVKADGKVIGKSSLTEVTMVDNAGHQQAVPSALSKNESFGVTWLSQN
jgi:hypothetical protein